MPAEEARHGIRHFGRPEGGAFVVRLGRAAGPKRARRSRSVPHGPQLSGGRHARPVFPGLGHGGVDSVRPARSGGLRGPGGRGGVCAGGGIALLGAGLVRFGHPAPAAARPQHRRIRPATLRQRPAPLGVGLVGAVHAVLHHGRTHGHRCHHRHAVGHPGQLDGGGRGRRHADLHRVGRSARQSGHRSLAGLAAGGAAGHRGGGGGAHAAQQCF